MKKHFVWILILYLGLFVIHPHAQDLQEGDPPLASKITVETATDITVTIIGEEGAVFPSAQVAIRNLYTGATEFVQARANGSFEAVISGLPLMPYQVNLARSYPTHERDSYDMLPGIGTIIYPNYDSLNNLPFTFGGQLSHGTGVYFAEGRINQLRFNTGDAFKMTLNIRFFIEDLDTSIPFTMIGNIGFRRLFDENGKQLSTAIGSGDDWSSELTPTGLPILGRTVPDMLLATASTDRLSVDEETREISFSFTFEASIPDDLAAGIYVPVFTGQSSIGNSEPFDWYANLVFSTASKDNGGHSSTVLPLVLGVGEAEILDLESDFSNQLKNIPIWLKTAFGDPYGFINEAHLQTAENLTLSPSILAGTPLEIGQHIAFSGTVSPAFPAKIDTGMTSGNANRFGYFYLENTDFSEFEYLINWEASAEEGLWQGQISTTGLITNAIANGAQGLADYDRNPQAWFDTTTYPPDAPDILPFANFPFFSGDVAYIPASEDAGINPILSGGDYQYLCIVRPDGTLHQFVRDSDATFDVRVSLGNEGNREGDVLFLFGGTVASDDVRGYSSVAVVTDHDSARVVPPFSEPLLYDSVQPVDMFVLATGVRPGQVLEVGDTFANVGFVAPTVAADIMTTIRTPSETIIHVTQASRYGYFYEPEHNFTITEAGVYRVNIEATYAGDTSAGLLANPVSGTVLGADNGYTIFVVEPDSPMLTTPRDSISQLAVGQAFTINVRAPQAWTGVQAHYLVRTAQQILEQGELNIFANQTNYSFNWPRLAQLFPNLETRASEASNMDEITLSFAMTGLDENGNPQIQARIFTLRGNALYTFGE
jgi:hypothetical protein